MYESPRVPPSLRRAQVPIIALHVATLAVKHEGEASDLRMLLVKD